MHPVDLKRAAGAVLFAVATACGAPGPGARHTAGITLAGSTSIQPFAERWAELYRGGRVTVQAGGSTAGIRAALDGTAEIGMSSRALRDGEGRGLVQTLVARDAIAVIVHPANPVRALTIDQLRDVYAGRIDNWRAVGGDLAPITAITREDGSGTRDAFEQFVMGSARISPGALVTAYSGGLRKMVAQDPHAIGFVTFSQVDSTVRAVALDGVLPSEATIANGAYRVQRPFLFLTRGNPGGAARDFIAFVLSPEGQRLARAEGLAGVAP